MAAFQNPATAALPALPKTAGPADRLARARLEFSRYWVRHATLHELIGKEDLPNLKQLVAARAEVGNINSLGDLVWIDIRAMCEQLDHIVHLLCEQDLRDDALKSLERLRALVAHPRWTNQIAFLRALAFLYPNWTRRGEEAARKELASLSWRDIRNPEILQVYASLFANSFGLGEALKVYQKLVEICERPGEKLQYGLLESVVLASHGDMSGAGERLSDAIEQYESRPGPSTNSYSLLQYGRSLTTAGLWGLRGPEESLRKAIAALDEVLALGQVNDAGRADVEHEKGRAFAGLKQWEAAEQSYTKAQSYQFSPATTVAHADLLSSTGSGDQARAMLHALDYDALEPEQKFDVCMSFVRAAAASGNTSAEELQLFDRRLQQLEPPYPWLSEHLRRVQMWVADGRRLEERAAAVVGPSTSSPARDPMDEMRRAIAEHRSLPPQQLTQALPSREQLPDYIIRISVEVWSKLVENRRLLTTEARSLEDTYTAYVKTLLQQRVAEYQWSVDDQNMGGLPGGESSERGRRDLVIQSPGDTPFGLWEAVRCSSMGRSGWNSVSEHMNRASMRYDAVGSAVMVLVVYAEVDNFGSFVQKYVGWLASEDCDGGSSPSTQLRWKRDGLLRGALKLIQSDHLVQGDHRQFVHLLVHTGR